MVGENNATLTIEPGTFIIGQPGSQPPSVLVVSRNGKLNASGTSSRPIIMTSSRPFGQRQRGDWGGLIMLGRAPINVGANAVAGQTNQAGEFYIEGLRQPRLSMGEPTPTTAAERSGTCASSMRDPFCRRTTKPTRLLGADAAKERSRITYRQSMASTTRSSGSAARWMPSTW